MSRSEINMSELADRMRITAKAVERGATNTIRAGAKATVRALIQTTPVDTGAAVSNWRVGLNFTPKGIIQPHSPGKKGSTARANKDAAISAAENVINKFTSRKGEASKRIYIINNSPYINRLNQGYSKQAPAGFVEAAVAAGLRKMKDKGLMNLQSFSSGGDE